MAQPIPLEAARMLMTGSGPIDAERAFTREARSRRRAALARWLRRRPAGHGRLRVFDERALGTARRRPGRALREIPVDAIHGTLEPSRAALFDREFRPAASARCRWQRLWLAEQRGALLPPISVVAVGDVYAISDGHHRVSVARARGAATVDAVVDGRHNGALRNL
jgi:hypothetical protein